MKKKKFFVSLISTLLFLIFLSIMDYPFLARMFNERNQGAVVVDYEETLGKRSDPEKERMLEEARKYNSSLASGLGNALEETLKKNPEEQQADQIYQGLLSDQADGVIGRIEIPKLAVNLLIYHGTEEEVLQKGAGHLQGSSLPVGGESTHSCISAHRGLVDKKMFTDLDQMEVGDLFLIHVLGETLAYRVREIQTVLPDDVEDLAIQRGKDLVTLITCTPYGINTHRIYVHGERIPYTEEVEAEVNAEQEESKSWWESWWENWWWAVFSLLLLILLIALLWRYNRRA